MARIDQPEPTVFPRGGSYAADLRRWKAGRPTLRDPFAPGWPRRGDTTPFEDVAKKWAREYRDRILQKKYRKQTGQPEDEGKLSDAWKRYEKHRERTVEANTLSQDGTSIGHLKAWLKDDVPVHTITAPTLQKMVDARLDEGYKRSSVKGYVHSLSAFFRWLGGHNPAAEVVVPKPERGDARAWSDAEVKQLRKAADKLGPAYRRFLELGICTGGRYSELIALEWEDFDPTHHTVRFRRQAVAEGTRRTKGLKGDQNRTALVLREWWPFYEAGRGRILHISRPMGKILEQAELREPAILNHAMRHTYARICRERYKIPISVLKVYLGHSSERITEKFYGWMGRDVALEMGHSLVYGR